MGKYFVTCEFKCGEYGEVFHFVVSGKDDIEFLAKLDEYLRTYYDDGDCERDPESNTYTYFSGWVVIEVSRYSRLSDISEEALDHILGELEVIQK